MNLHHPRIGPSKPIAAPPALSVAKATGVEDKTATELPTLAVVVITRNEAAHIAACLEAVCAATRPLTGARVVVVDSDSDDDTVEVAARFPVEVYRYRAPRRTAAAGRAVGTHLVRACYILFVDGDSVIEPSWLSRALELLQADPGAGVAFGQRREIYESVGAFFRTGVPETPGLGGTALYRLAALAAAGGFHPYLTSDEEAELRARIERNGYVVHQMPELMFTHYTVPKDTWRGYSHRIRRSMFSGYGQVLRAAWRDGSFLHHVRRLNRPVIVILYMLAGVGGAVAVASGAPAPVLMVWAGGGLLAFGLLWLRRRAFGAALYIVCDWTLSALGLAAGFIAGVPDRSCFRPLVERRHIADDGTSYWRALEWPR